MAINGGHIYWTNGSAIGRANLNGTGVDQDSPSTSPSRALSPGEEWPSTRCSTSGTTKAAVVTRQGGPTSDGTGVDPKFITGLDSSPGMGGRIFVAIGAGHLYWRHCIPGASAHDRSIGRANLNGTNGDQKFITGADNPDGVSVYNGHLYWANGGPFSQGSPISHSTIGRASVAGTGVDENFITGALGSCGVTIYGGYVYWGNDDNELGSTVGRASLNGTGVNEKFITGAQVPCGVAVG